MKKKHHKKNKETMGKMDELLYIQKTKFYPEKIGHYA